MTNKHMLSTNEQRSIIAILEQLAYYAPGIVTNPLIRFDGITPLRARELLAIVRSLELLETKCPYCDSINQMKS